MGETKYIFVTGGVASSLGKGIISASLAKLLQSRGLSVTIQNALIIEFFDSIEIIIQIHNVCDDWWFRVKSKTKTIKSEKYNEYKNRQQATIQAIEKANDLYNSSNGWTVDVIAHIFGGLS